MNALRLASDKCSNEVLAVVSTLAKVHGEFDTKTIHAAYNDPELVGGAAYIGEIGSAPTSNKIMAYLSAVVSCRMTSMERIALIVAVLSVPSQIM